MDYRIDDRQFEYLNGLPAPPYVLRRFHSNTQNHRYYYEIIGEEPVLYSSLTTMISDGYPDSSSYLEDWKSNMRAKGINPEEYAEYRANYGTIMHILFANYVKGDNIPLSPQKFVEYVRTIDTGLSLVTVDNVLKSETTELTKDLLSFAQFMKDYNVKPLAVELMLRDYEARVGTPIDFICELDWEITGYFGETYATTTKYAKKGDPKQSKKKVRVLAILDFKSGRKGFYDKHALQLGKSKEIFEKNYPNRKVDFLFNFSPKDWRTSPTYNLKDQTNNPVLEEMEHVFAIGKMRFLKKEKLFKSFGGVLSIKEEFNPERFSREETVEEFLKRVEREKKEEEEKNKKDKVSGNSENSKTKAKKA